MIRPSALEDVRAMQAWISRDSVSAGERFFEQAVATADGLLEWPMANWLLELPGIEGLGLRRAIIKGFPNHLLVYSVTDDVVIIEHAFHAAQDWAKRLG